MIEPQKQKTTTTTENNNNRKQQQQLQQQQSTLYEDFLTVAYVHERNKNNSCNTRIGDLDSISDLSSDSSVFTLLCDCCSACCALFASTVEDD